MLTDFGIFPKILDIIRTHPFIEFWFIPWSLFITGSYSKCKHSSDIHSPFIYDNVTLDDSKLTFEIDFPGSTIAFGLVPYEMGLVLYRN